MTKQNSRLTVAIVSSLIYAERYRSLTSLYYREAQAAILVYDITSRESFEDLLSWVEGKTHKIVFGGR
jgi:hypothetical protein